MSELRRERDQLRTTLEDMVSWHSDCGCHGCRFAKKVLDENKPYVGFYIMANQQIMDGPFDTKTAAIEHLKIMCGEWASPELLSQFLAHFDGQILELVKDENGEVINGHLIRERFTE